MNKRISQIFKKLSKEKIDYYLISSKDEYLNEYVPSYNRRLEWLTNFKGSNGIAMISKNKQYFFTDGRYLLQAEKEIDKNFNIIDSNSENIFSFFKNKIKGKKILVDFKIFSVEFMIKLIRTAKLNQDEFKGEKASDTIGVVTARKGRNPLDSLGGSKTIKAANVEEIEKFMADRGVDLDFAYGAADLGNEGPINKVK